MILINVFFSVKFKIRLATEETPKSPSSSRSTTPETPPSATFSSPTNGQGVKLFDSLISFEVKRPEFHKNVKKEIVDEEYAPKLVLNTGDDNNGLEENDAINSGSGALVGILSVILLCVGHLLFSIYYSGQDIYNV